MFRRTTALWATAFLSIAVTAEKSFAFRSGPPAAHNGSTASGGATCRVCHGSASGGGMVQILGAPAEYEADALYNLTVRVTDAAKAGAGFQLSVETAAGAQAGTILVSDADNTQLNPNAGVVWINHTLAGVDDAVANWVAMGNSAEYHLEWLAPAGDVGPVTFWAAGNAINDDDFNTGDVIYLHNQSATFTEDVPVPAVSTWSLIAMGLILITAGTVVIGRGAVAPKRIH